MTKRIETAMPASTFDGACRSAFGAPPEDVINPLKSAAEALIQLREILKTISNEALDTRTVTGYRLKSLADAGAYLAYDIGEYAGGEFERMRDSLVSAGVLNAEDGHE